MSDANASAAASGQPADGSPAPNQPGKQANGENAVATQKTPAGAAAKEVQRVNGAPQNGAKPTNGAAPKGGDVATQESTEAAVKAAVKKYKLQVNGAEIEATAEEIMESLGSDRVIRADQMERAVRTRMREVAEREKMLKAAAEDLRDPDRAMALMRRIHGREKVGQMSEREYIAFMQEQAMDPAERKRREEMTAFERDKQDMAKWKQARVEEAKKARVSQNLTDYGRKSAEAATKAGLDPKANPRIIAEMAALIEGSLGDGAPYTWDEAAAIVAREHGESFTKRVRGMTPEQLVEALGEEGVRAFRKWDVARLKARRENGQFAKGTVMQQAKPVQREIPHVSEAEEQSINGFFKSLKRR